MIEKEKENIIDAIEERLNQLEKEKDLIEKMYGINEDLINDLTNTTSKNTNKNIFATKGNKTKTNSSTIQKNYYNNSSIPLPKLEAGLKKDISAKSFYKTPDALQDSLKYEPNIKDLLDVNDLEPSYTNLNNLKTSPFIPKGNNISNYVDFINEDYIIDYIN